MINQEQFEFHQHIVDWLTEGGIPFQEALSIVNYAEQMNYSIPQAFIELLPPYIVKEDGDEEKKDT